MAKKDQANNKKENNKNKKSFLKDFRAELKRVIWPTPKQLFNNTVAVISIVLVTAVIVFVLDVAFESLNEYGVDKIKESVTAINSTSEDSNNATENTTDSQTSETSEQTNTNVTEENTSTEVNNTNTENNAQ